MTVYEVVPHVGAGPVRLGMSREEVRRSMPGPCTPFRKAPGDAYEVDAFHGTGFQVFYGGESPVVEYVELSRDSGFVASCCGVDVFAATVDEVVALVSGLAPFDLERPESGHSYVFPWNDLSLWRPTQPHGSPEDEGGPRFSTIGVGVPGYFRGLFR